jgi:hypothetical protein
MRRRRRSNFARPYICRFSIFNAVDLALDRAGVPRQGQAGSDGGEVTL